MTCDIFRAKAKFSSLSISVMATAGGESLDRGAKDDEKKKRPEVGD